MESGILFPFWLKRSQIAQCSFCCRLICKHHHLPKHSQILRVMDLVRKVQSDIELHKLLFASPPLNVYNLQKEKNWRENAEKCCFSWAHSLAHFRCTCFFHSNSFHFPHFLGLLLFFSLPILISFLPKELFLTAASPAVKWIIQGKFLTIARIVLQNTLNSLQVCQKKLHMTAACTECFISGQYSSLQCVLNLCFTLSKQFIADILTTADEDPALGDLGFQSLVSKGSLTLFWLSMKFSKHTIQQHIPWCNVN